ncbi:MAG: serine/threonine-protein kinase [Bacteroidota bacterium]
MNADRWQRIDDLFNATLAQPPEARAAFLAEACADDPVLCTEVQRLLDADAVEHELLDGQAADAVDVNAAFSREGTRVGPYVLRERLGAGGMGEVYRAERADGQFEQQVALKLIKLGMDSEQILRRFQSERQILARLQHPHIARLLDGGLLPDGRSYFAMAYIDGQPIDAYCASHDIGLRGRLALFETVCEAVRYAHVNLVVHRDLKPDNIFVTPEGQVKLLDFGIAKVLAADAAEAAFTQPGQAALTPAYAAPEHLRGEGVSTASDVYSLGVVLYELLTGVRPYEVPSASRLEAARIVSETVPEKPSTRVARQPQVVEVASAAPTPTVTWQRHLAGDLDIICLKALQNDPSRRYASVEAFADDIRRYLDGRPVLAQPDRFSYRASKFIRRHRWPVTSAAATLIIVIALVAFYTGQLAQERDRALVEQAKAEQVSAFLQDLFEVSGPGEARGATLTAQALLDSGAARIRTELAEQPEVQATMLAVIGNVYRRMGSVQQAAPLLEEAVVQQRAGLGAAHPDVIGSMSRLAELYRDQGRYNASDSLHQVVLALRKRVFGAQHLEVAQSLNHLGSLRRNQGDYEAAESLFVQALDHRRRLADPESGMLVESLVDLANLYTDMGEYEQAEMQYREALTISRKTRGDDAPGTITIMSNLAGLLYEKGDLAAAEVIDREALAVRRRLYPDGSANLAVSLSGLALTLQDQGKYEEAEALYREALAMDRRYLGDEHPYVASDLGNLATLLYDMGDYERARPFYEESLALRRAIHPPNHPGLMTAENNYAFFMMETGEFETSEAMLLDLLPRMQDALGEGHPRVGQTLHNLGRVRYKMGDYALAEERHRASLASWTASLGADHPYVALSRGSLGAVLTAQQDYAAAEPLLVESYPALAESFGPQSQHAQDALGRLIALYDVWGRPDEQRRYQALADSLNV